MRGVAMRCIIYGVFGAVLAAADRLHFNGAIHYSKTAVSLSIKPPRASWIRVIICIVRAD